MASPITFKGPYDFRTPQLRKPIRSLQDADLQLEQLYITLQQVFLAINQQSEIIAVHFSEAVGYGKLVNLYQVAGVLTARNANSGTGGTSGAVQPCHGFVWSLTGVASGSSAFVQLGTAVLQGLIGLTVGAPYYTSTTNGAVSATRDTSVGHIEQYVGVALSPTTIAFGAHPWIQH